MDESWVTCGDSADKHLYLTHNDSVPEVDTKESPKHVNVVTCVNIHGNMITNVYLSDGSPPPIGLFDDVHADYPGHITCPRGFMNGDGLAEWVENYFLPSVTPNMKPDEYGLLIVDAHSSRKTELYKNHLEEKNFHVLVLPARNTSFFQPLDLSVFGSLKHCYSKEGGSSNPFQCMVQSQLALKEIKESSITAGWDKSRLLNDEWESFSFLYFQ